MGVVRVRSVLLLRLLRFVVTLGFKAISFMVLVSGGRRGR